MSSIVSRIEQIARAEGLTITGLEAKIGASKGVLSRALNQGTDIQTKWLLAVVENYPLYSSEWILKGKGEMLVTTNSKTYQTEETPRTLNEPEIPYHLPTSIEEERKTLIASINRMTDTADRNSRTLEKIVDYLVSKDINIE